MSSYEMKPTESDSHHCFRCTDEHSNPRLLHCFHSFCITCLESVSHQRPSGSSISSIYSSSSSSSDVIICPDCSEPTLLPLNGSLDHLPRSNIFGKRILDINKILRRSTDQEPCSGCPRDPRDPNSVVSSYCLDCQEFFCSACAVVHTHFRFAASHRLITGGVAEVRKPRDFVQGETTSRFCEVHVDEREAFYCRQCDVCICELCYSSEDHDSCCEGVELIDAMKGQLEEFVEKTIQDIRMRIDCETEFLKRLQRDERQLIRRVNSAEDELENESFAVVDLMTRSSKDLQHQLDNEARQRMEMYENTTRAASQQVDDLRTFRTTVTRLLEKASPAHLVSINSGGSLRRVERETRDFSESWKTMLVAFDESKELEELLGDESIGDVLGRLEETDSDHGYLDDDDDDDNNSNGAGYHVDVIMDRSSGRIDNNRTDETGFNGDVEVDIGSHVRVGDRKTGDEDVEKNEVMESSGEVADLEVAIAKDDVGMGVDEDKEQVEEEEEEGKEEKEKQKEGKEERMEECESLSSRTTLMRNENREITRGDLESALDRPARPGLVELNWLLEGTDYITKPRSINESRGKKMRVNYKGNTRMFTVPGDEADVDYEFIMENNDYPHPKIYHCSNERNDVASDTVRNGSDQRAANEDKTRSEDSDRQILTPIGHHRVHWVHETTGEGQHVTFLSGAAPPSSGKQDFPFNFCQPLSSSSDVSNASEKEMSFLLNQKDQVRGEVTSGSTRFFTIDPPITIRQTGSGQDSTGSLLSVTSGCPIAEKQTGSDTSNYPITIRESGIEQRSTWTIPSGFQFGGIHNLPRSESADPEVLFCHDAAIYRGTQRAGSGVIKVLIGQEDNGNTAEVYLEWDEVLELPTSDSALELLTLQDHETHAIKFSSRRAEFDQRASALQFENSEDSRQFENTLDQLIGQMNSLRIVNEAMPC